MVGRSGASLGSAARGQPKVPGGCGRGPLDPVAAEREAPARLRAPRATRRSRRGRRPSGPRTAVRQGLVGPPDDRPWTETTGSVIPFLALRAEELSPPAPTPGGQPLRAPGGGAGRKKSGPPAGGPSASRAPSEPEMVRETEPQAKCRAAGHGKRSAGPVTVHFVAPDPLRFRPTAGFSRTARPSRAARCGPVKPGMRGAPARDSRSSDGCAGRGKGKGSGDVAETERRKDAHEMRGWTANHRHDGWQSV